MYSKRITTAFGDVILTRKNDIVQLLFYSGSIAVSGLNIWRTICTIPDGYKPILTVNCTGAGDGDYILAQIEHSFQIYNKVTNSLSYIRVEVTYFTDDPSPS